MNIFYYPVTKEREREKERASEQASEHRASSADIEEKGKGM